MENESKQYPQLDKALNSEESGAILEGVEKTCRRLDEFVKSGSPQEKSRAQAAMAAYGRTLDLLRTLAETRDRMMAAK